MWDEEHYRVLCRNFLTHYQISGIVFGYLPLTEAQLQVAEDQLGFHLPPLLRVLYEEAVKIKMTGKNVATNGLRASKSGWRLHPCIVEALQRHPGSYVECDEYPDRFVPISDEGCGITVEFDAWTGRVYYAACGEELPLDNGERIWLLALAFAEASLEEWLEKVFNRTPYQETILSAPLTSDMLAPTCTDAPQEVWKGLYRFEPWRYGFEDKPIVD